AQGDPLTGPTSIDITSNGATLLVADPGALIAGDDRGAIWSLPSTGGTLSELSGPSGFHPRGLVVVTGNGGDDVYFTGLDKADGAPGLFKVAAAGGQVAAIVKGAPFIDP